MVKLPRIIIVDDHSLFREGIRLIIEHEELGEVICEAENGLDFLEKLENGIPDLVLMDIEMPIMNGIEATQRAVVKHPSLKVLALTMADERDIYLDMVNAGAKGFIWKNSGKRELERAIKMILAGESYFSNDLLLQIIQKYNRAPQPQQEIAPPELTERDMEVLQLLCEGYTPSEIADKIFKSIKTVEAHRSKLLQKTDTKNTINLVLYAIKNKLVEI
jgi:DNA-binding NarL/FixJ family response regulator